MTLIGKIRQIYLNRFGPAQVVVQAALQRAATLRNKGRKRAANRILWRLQRQFGVHVSIGAHYEQDLILPHPVNVIIGREVTIDRGVKIYQGVTIGAEDDSLAGRYPKIGENTVIYAGAVIIGPVTIGQNCVIGANAVVLSDIPSNSVAVGAPARYFQRKPVPRIAEEKGR